MLECLFAVRGQGFMTLRTFPNSPFQLFEPFQPAGDQPEAIAKLIEGIGDGLAYQTLLGVTGSGKTYTMAQVIARTGFGWRDKYC